jgi:hypothetical protein
MAAAGNAVNTKQRLVSRTNQYGALLFFLTGSCAMTPPQAEFPNSLAYLKCKEHFMLTTR